METPEGDNWVWLLISTDNFLGHSEAFSAAYVKDCVEQRRIVLDLAKYRVGSMAPRFRIRPVRTKSPDKGFESGGDDEDLDDFSAKRNETTPNNCDQDETTKAVSEPRKIFLMVPCQYCRKSFKDDKCLMNHEKKVHNKTVQSSKEMPCTWCSKTFVSDEGLQRHLYRCGKRPNSYSCKLFDETFVRNYLLQKHEIVHTN